MSVSRYKVQEGSCAGDKIPKPFSRKVCRLSPQASKEVRVAAMRLLHHLSQSCHTPTHLAPGSPMADAEIQYSAI